MRICFRLAWLVFGAALTILRLAAQDATSCAPVLRKIGGESIELSSPAQAWKVRYPKERASENEIGCGFVVAYVWAGGIEKDYGRGGERAYAQAAEDASEHAFESTPVKWTGNEFGYVWRAVLFNPLSAMGKGPEATPRLLGVEPVFLSSRLMKTGGFVVSRLFRMGKLRIAVDGSVVAVTILGDKRLLDTAGHHKRDRQPMELVAEVQSEIERVIKRWRFAPARKDGVPVEAEVLIKIPIWLDPLEVLSSDQALPRIPPGDRLKFKKWPVKAQRQGSARVEFVVDCEGRVRVPVVVEASDPGFGQAAIETIKFWRFEVVERDGAPCNVRMQHTFHYDRDDGYLQLVDLLDNAEPPKILGGRAGLKIEFPKKMEGENYNANIIAEVEIDDQGRPQNPVIVQSTHPLFNDAMIDGIMKTEFAPGKRGGVPVSVRCLIYAGFGPWNGPGEELAEVQKPNEKDQKHIPSNLRFERMPETISVIQPVYPYSLLLEGITGEATVVMMVNAKGGVDQSYVASCSRQEFGQALATAAEGYLFKPGLRDGRPASGLFSITCRFELPAMQDDGYLVKWEREKKGDIVSAVLLDKPLAVMSRYEPIFPRNLLGKHKEGQAMIEFLVDEQGKVRLPRSVSATEPSFGYAATQAVALWRFTPPTVKGKGVIVRVKAPVLFQREGSGSEKVSSASPSSGSQ